MLHCLLEAFIFAMKSQDVPLEGIEGILLIFDHVSILQMDLMHDQLVLYVYHLRNHFLMVLSLGSNTLVAIDRHSENVAFYFLFFINIGTLIMFTIMGFRMNLSSLSLKDIVELSLDCVERNLSLWFLYHG